MEWTVVIGASPEELLAGFVEAWKGAEAGNIDGRRILSFGSEAAAESYFSTCESEDERRAYRRWKEREL